MMAMIDRMESREKLIVFGGGALAVLIVAYFFVWEPWQVRLEQLRQQVPNKQQTLTWMQEQSRTLQLLLNKTRTGGDNSGVPLLTVVEQSAANASVREFIRRMAPGDSPSQVKVWLTEANFDVWLAWLEALRNSGVEVVSANVSSAKDSKVTIRVTLERS